MVLSDLNLDQKNEKDSEGLIKLYGSIKNIKSIMGAY